MLGQLGFSVENKIFLLPCQMNQMMAFWLLVTNFLASFWKSCLCCFCESESHIHNYNFVVCGLLYALHCILLYLRHFIILGLQSRDVFIVEQLTVYEQEKEDWKHNETQDKNSHKFTVPKTEFATVSTLAGLWSMFLLFTSW